MAGNVKKGAPPTVMNDLLLGKTQELVSTSEGERNWPGVLIALLVILVVLSLILVSTMILSPGDRLPRVSKPKMDIVTRPIDKKNPPLWTSRNEVVYRNILGGISIYNPDQNTTLELLDNSTFRQLDAVDYLLSADYEYLIFISNVKKIYKNTQEAVYHLYEISSKTRWDIAPVEEDFHEMPFYLNRVVFSPKGHDLAFVHNGQVYYVKDADRKPKLVSPKSSQWVRHGLPDWIYQNDILCDDEAFFFSPEGDYLAFLTFDDRNVGKIPVSRYDQDIYARVVEIPYPKTGTTNPEVNVTVVDLNDLTTKILQKPKILEKSTPYLTDIEWDSDSNLNLVWVNRRQNLTVLDGCAPPNFTCETKSTMNKIGHLRPSKTTFEVRKYLDMSSSYPYFFKKDKFFQAHPDNKPTQRHLYIMESEYNPICLTCPIRKGNLTTDVAVPNNTVEDISHPVKSTDCLYTMSDLSPDRKYYMVTCLGPDVPSIHIMDLTTNKKIYTITNNDDLRQNYYSYALPLIKIFQVKLDDMRIAQVKLRLPPGLREYEETTFPFLLKISHRPGEPSVDHKWSMDYDSYLSSAKNYIIAEVDTGEKVIGPGAAYDQISVVRYLISNLNFIDKDKIGVYGLNYGGYLTAMILSLDAEDFKCGVSISGVFSWPHYNSVWTEAWLRTANITDNYRGYEDADILRRAGNLKNKKFLMIDSAVDYDVHYQHAMLMIRSLVKADVMFNHMTYPDDPEDLYVSKHFHTMTDQFWDDCFGHPDFTDWELGLSSYLSIKTG